MMNKFYYNVDTRKLCDWSGSTVQTVPELAYGEKTLWHLTLLREDGNVMLPESAEFYKAAVASDFESSTQVMCRTLPEGITVNENMISVRIDAETNTFLNAVNGRESTKAHFELSGFDTDGNKIFYLIFRINARMVLDPDVDESVPPAPESDYLTATQLYHVLHAEDEFEFNTEPEGEGHAIQLEMDRYFRKRNRALEGNWSEWIRLPDAVVKDYQIASRTTDGLMSAQDKCKLEDLDASALPVTDSKSYFTANNTEGVLQEIGKKLRSLTASEIDITDTDKNFESSSVEGALQEIADSLTALDEKDCVPVGTIIACAGTIGPAGYAVCQGAEVSRTAYADLFAVIGTAYGNGNGSTTFTLPDLRGRFLQGLDTGFVGTYIDPGLPDITGQFETLAWDQGIASGAVSISGTSGTLGYISGENLSDVFYQFKASGSDPVYGKSQTVQPPAVKINFWIKY